MDGRDFIRQAFRDIASRDDRKTFQHVVMNLPATAIEFLDAFRDVYSGSWQQSEMPEIHCHCFSKDPEPATEIAQVLLI